jgi:hypothetical protein
MPDENPTPAERENMTDSVILLLLLRQASAGPWTMREIERELDENPADGLRRLDGAGLVHRRGGFVWASRAAVKADELDS